MYTVGAAILARAQVAGRKKTYFFLNNPSKVFYTFSLGGLIFTFQESVFGISKTNLLKGTVS